MHHDTELIAVSVVVLALVIAAAVRAAARRTGFPFTVAMLLAGGALGWALGHWSPNEHGVAQVLGRGAGIAPHLGGGDLLGEMALVTGEPRTATARAASTVTLGRISKADFDQLMSQRPRVRQRVLSAVAARAEANRIRLTSRMVRHPARS